MVQICRLLGCMGLYFYGVLCIPVIVQRVRIRLALHILIKDTLNLL